MATWPGIPHRPNRQTDWAPQGKGSDVAHKISAVSTFGVKLCFLSWNTHTFSYFPGETFTEFVWDPYEMEDIVGFLMSPFMPTETVTKYSEAQEALSFPNVVDMEIVRPQYNMSTFRAEPNHNQFSDLLNWE